MKRTSLWHCDEANAEYAFGHFGENKMVAAGGRTKRPQYVVQLFRAVAAGGHSTHTRPTA